MKYSEVKRIYKQAKSMVYENCFDERSLARDMIRAAQQSVHLTALRRGLALSLLFNAVLLAVVLATIGGR